jgi:hypothetical protein
MRLHVDYADAGAKNFAPYGTNIAGNQSPERWGIKNLDFIENNFVPFYVVIILCKILNIITSSL